MFSLHSLHQENLFLIYLVTTVMFSKPVFSFYENEGLAKPELALSEPAPFDISVTVESVNINFSSKLCSLLVFKIKILNYKK